MELSQAILQTFPGGRFRRREDAVSGYLLMFGLLAGDTVAVLPEVSGTYYESLASCEEAANHPAVRASYEDAYEGDELRIWCEAVGPTPRSLRIRKQDNDHWEILPVDEGAEKAPVPKPDD